jgi:hypothetical protein
MKLSTIQNTPAPALFASVRSSRDLSLVAFATALLTAFALQAGAFLPRLSPAETREEAPAIQPTTPRPAPAVVASQPVPCELPRG